MLKQHCLEGILAKEVLPEQRISYCEGIYLQLITLYSVVSWSKILLFCRRVRKCVTKVNIEDIEQGTTCDDYIASSVGSEDDDVVSNAGSDNSYESVRVRSSSPPALLPRLPPKASGTEITEMTFGVNNENALCNIGLTDNDTDEETPGHMPLHYSYTPSEGSSSPRIKRDSFLRRCLLKVPVSIKKIQDVKQMMQMGCTAACHQSITYYHQFQLKLMICHQQWKGK